jgi:hypothetical protein
LKGFGGQLIVFTTTTPRAGGVMRGTPYSTPDQ